MNELKIACHLPNRERCGIATYAKNLYAQADKLNSIINNDETAKTEIKLQPFDTKLADLFKLLFKKVDVIHFQHEFGIWPLFGLSFLIYLSFLSAINLIQNRKIVVTMHTVWEINKLDKIFAHYPKYLQFIISIYLKTSYFLITNLSHKVLVLNENSVEVLNQFSSNKKKVEYLPHGLFLPEKNEVGFEVLSKNYNLKLEEKLIVMFGFAYPNKGFHLAIEALPEILKKVPEAKIILACSAPSDGGQNYMETLENLAIKLNIQDKVIFTGFLEDNDPKLQAIFKYATCFVYPYFNRSGASGSVATVFGYEKPILVSNIQFFENFSFLPKFKEGDVQDLTLQIVQLLLENRDSKGYENYLNSIKQYLDKHSIRQSFQLQIKTFLNLF